MGHDENYWVTSNFVLLFKTRARSLTALRLTTFKLAIVPNVAMVLPILFDDGRITVYNLFEEKKKSEHYH